MSGRAPSSEAEIRASWVDEPPVLNTTVTLAEFDPGRPVRYDREAGRIRAALGERVVVLEHVGSTSVPGLCAKRVVDVMLAVADSADEDAYRLVIRERDLYANTQREPAKRTWKYVQTTPTPRARSSGRS